MLLKALYNGDFGTVKIQQQTLSYCGPWGYIAYGAPEAADFTKHSPRMDIYSYGVLMLEVLAKMAHLFQMVDDLKAQVHQWFPQYYQLQLVTSCIAQQSSDRPTMYMSLSS